ncbi:hypothetical protein HRED_06053, partial [Candidatus Haloredivivus sp. G17]
TLMNEMDAIKSAENPTTVVIEDPSIARPQSSTCYCKCRAGRKNQKTA